MSLEGGPQGGRREHEHAAVPIAVAAGYQARGLVAGRFLDKAVNREGAVEAAERRPASDIAEGRVRIGRSHAESDQAAFGGGSRGQHYRAGQDVGIIDGMIGRRRPQDRVGEMGFGVERGQGDSGRRVAPGGLGNNVAAEVGVNVAKLVEHGEIVSLGGHRDDLPGGRRGQGAPRRLLQQGFIAGQGQQLFGVGLAAGRPQSGADTAGQKYRNQGCHGGHLYTGTAALRQGP